METMTTEDFLNFLAGKQPDAIAAWLLERGFKGWHDGYSCPVARALNKATGGWHLVGKKDVIVVDDVVGHNAEDYLYQTVDLPDSVKNFVQEYDRNGYPELVAQ